MSRNAFLTAMALLGAFGAWQHFRGKTEQAAQGPGEASVLTAPSSKTAVLVYGRDNCAYTQRTLASLRTNDIPVTYINIDYVDANRLFHEKFDGTSLAGDRGYALPVVELAGHVSMRPDPDTVARQFRSIY